MTEKSSDPPSRRVVARAPRAIIGIVLQAIAFALVWGVGVPRLILVWRGSTRVDVYVTISASVIAVVALGLVFVAMHYLGRQWAITARTIERHELVTAGPYRAVRHPIYLGVGGFFIAIGLLLAPVWALLAACVFYAVGTAIRIRAEDGLMAATFGAAFEEYRRRVPALIPRFPRATNRD
jgi:protein-S-isoprenylcysteine O-methyltransferase Ste14